MSTDANSCEHRSVIGDSNVVFENSSCVGDILLVHDAVGVAVEVGVVGDAHPVAQGNPPAIVQQHVPVNHDIVAHLKIVTEGKLHELKCFEVATHPGKDVPRENTAKPNSQMDVSAAQRGAVEVLPEPDQW